MMKVVLLLGVTLSLAVIVMPLTAPVRAATPRAAALPTVEIEAPSLEPVPALEEAKISPIAEYLLGVMGDWPTALPALPALSYQDVATSIAAVTDDPKDAVLLASLGYFEGVRFAIYVDSSACNDPAWVRSDEGQHLSHYGTCDRGPTDKVGRAHSIWQIHPVEDRSSSLYAICNEKVIDSSREDAGRCALALAKNSLKETGTLSWYTGEWNGPHPKADQRLEFAQRASKKHPFK